MTNAIPNSRLAEIEAALPEFVNQMRPVIAATPHGIRAAVMSELQANLERTYAVMLGRPGPRSEEDILIVEKVRDALMGLFGDT